MGGYGRAMVTCPCRVNIRRALAATAKRDPALSPERKRTSQRPNKQKEERPLRGPSLVYII